MALEETCAGLRREAGSGRLSPERRAEIETWLREQGERLARVGTGGQRISDEAKQRLLNIFLTLINLREALDRAFEPRVPGARK